MDMDQRDYDEKKELKKLIIRDLEQTRIELENPSGNPYHAKVTLNRAQKNLDTYIKLG